MSTYFKAVRPDGTDFRTGTIDYAAAMGGEPVTLPAVPNPWCCTSDVLHAATVPAETLGGGSWPCRLFEVIGTPVAEKGHQRGFFSLTVVREVDAYQALGPQGEQVAALIDRAGQLTVDESEKLGAAWYADGYAAGDAVWDAVWDTARVARYVALVARDAAWDAVWDAAGDAAQFAARDVAGVVARFAAGDAALALVVRDLISKEHYDLLTGPWVQVIGPAHPDDETTRNQENTK